MVDTAPYLWQLSLLDANERGPWLDAEFRHIRRVVLDQCSWIDLLPGWVHGGDPLLEELITKAPWEPQRTRIMWDSEVPEPRIVARWPELSTLPRPVALMREALSRRYGTIFDLVAVNFYRDGRDSVTWHGDRVRLTQPNALVATVSLGQARRFLLRPRGGGIATIRWQLGGGDLVVMGGRCQHDWEHCVPKTANAGARMAITFRHSGAAGQVPRRDP